MGCENCPLEVMRAKYIAAGIIVATREANADIKRYPDNQQPIVKKYAADIGAHINDANTIFACPIREICPRLAE